MMIVLVDGWFTADDPPFIHGDPTVNEYDRCLLSNSFFKRMITSIGFAFSIVNYKRSFVGSYGPDMRDWIKMCFLGKDMVESNFRFIYPTAPPR